jgi:pyruvate dehydrogenase E2 component (dihydrolipoamide acetyltransferase)
VAEAPSNCLLQAKEEQVPAAAASGNGRIKASPLARRLARERGIDLAALRGTGPEGRIVAEDVERAEAGAPAAAPASNRLLQAPVPAGEVERVPLTNIRRTIARRLTEAWQIAVFQLQTSADMTRVNALVARLRERDPDVRSPSPTSSRRFRPGADAPPRGERGVHRRRDPPPAERQRRSAVAAPRGLSCP